jgi:alpha-beta hydrolase superfamily lysophospholipase
MSPARETSSVTDHAGIEIVYDVYRGADASRGVVQLLHGWAEHAGRYQRLAAALTRAGFTVYADDHRGHGRTGERAGGIGDLGADGPDGVLLATRAVTERILADHPGSRVVLLGHSWGSFLAQQYLRHWGRDLAAAVLTGTTARTATSGSGVRNLNERFEPARTKYDWLSRDPVEVDLYVADPWCGFEIIRPGAGAAGDAQPLLPERTDADIRKDLPVLILNGGDDPVGGDAGGHALADRYRDAGLTDVELRVYDGARHELFNETNRDEVTNDLLRWLDRVVA